MNTAVDYEKQLVNDIAGFQHDPLGYVLYAFPWGEGVLKDKYPDDWQIEALNAVGMKYGKLLKAQCSTVTRKLFGRYSGTRHETSGVSGSASESSVIVGIISKLIPVTARYRTKRRFRI